MSRVRLGVALLALAWAGGLAPLLAGGVAYRVKDLNTQSWAGAGFAPQGPSSVGGRAVFLGSVGGEQGGLWATDGTTAGTGMIRELWPVGSALALPSGGALLPAGLPTLGTELWWTDGTTAGTRLVRDIDPAGNSSPYLLGVVGDVGFFAATEAGLGRELWASDGTTAGTRLVADLRAGAEDGLEWMPPAGVVSGRLVFRAADGAEGPELWGSDGTTAGTILLYSFVPGPEGGSPSSFFAAGDRLYFSAREPEHGRELWVTDGTASGTRLLFDIAPGPQDSSPRIYGLAAGRVFLEACDAEHGCEPWVSDGTLAGTYLVRDVRPGPADSFGWGGAAAAASGRFLFAADDGVHGVEPWVTDGTAAGTVLLDDLYPGADGSDANSFFSFGGDVLFAAFDADWTIRLWRSSGTPGGTRDLARVLGGGEEFGLEFAPLGARVVFNACWSSYHWTGCDLWSTDGTASGTAPIEPLQPSSPTNIDLLAAVPTGLVLTVEGTRPPGAYRSDGTEDGTYEMHALSSRWDAAVLAEAAPLPDGELLFAEVVYDGWICSLWRTDGDLLSRVRAFQPAFLQACPNGLTVLGDRVYFAADDWASLSGTELWATDGTARGTAIVRDLVKGYNGSWPTSLIAGPDRIWFAAGNSIWESAGTSGTTIEHPLPAEVGSWLYGVAPLGAPVSRVVFGADSRLLGLDPASNEIELLKTWSAGWEWGFDYTRALAGEQLYFFDRGPGGVCELWRTDGTAPGTARVREVACALGWGGPELADELVALGGKVYFQGCDTQSGCELWRSDGTEAGTGRLADFDPGVFSSSPASFTRVGDRLYFSACDAAAGCEPWVSDGTAAGSHRVADIWPGPLASLDLPRFTVSGRLVYFAADDGTGTELWAMPVEIFYDGFETGDTSRWQVGD